MKVSNSLAWSGIRHYGLREHGKCGSPVLFIVKVFRREIRLEMLIIISGTSTRILQYLCSDILRLEAPLVSAGLER